MDSGKDLIISDNALTRSLARWFDDYGDCIDTCDWSVCLPQIVNHLSSELLVTTVEHLRMREFVSVPADFLANMINGWLSNHDYIEQSDFDRYHHEAEEWSARLKEPRGS